MSAFDAARTSEASALPMWLPPIGGLLAATLVASLAYPQPAPHSLSSGQLIASALERVLGVLLANMVIVWGLCAVSARKLWPRARLLISATSLNALWLAPLVPMVRENSPWALVVTAALVAGAVKSLQLAKADVEESPAFDRDPARFRLLESRGFWWQVRGSLAALSAQAGIFAALAGYPFYAAMLVATSSAVWTLSFTKYADHRFPVSSHFASRASLFASLAIIFTAVGLLQYLRPMYGIRRFGLPNFALQSPTRGDRAGSEGGRKTANSSTVTDSEGDSGVILLPDKQTLTRLVAPAPAISTSPLRGHGVAKPLEIPFEGVYWFFKAPDVRPPLRSRQAHGSPEMLDVHSVDHRPLLMEAHENFGSIIDLDCCSRIQIAIRNADRYPQTVELELFLVDSRVPGRPSQSLGKTMVTSTRPWKLYDQQQSPTNETLNFALPTKSSLRGFDEVSIVFRIDSARASTAPRIAIDRLVLIPRGL